ncbi:MAG TPA: cytochrome c maturation protein CcmE [Sedimentisphaerales bacterium]|nr:cytochrome c maturation protein CcmE [Sedimentisphaerales bacterium]
MSNKRKIIKAVIAVVIIGASGLYLIGQAAKSSWAYYCDVDEFLQKPKIGSTVRLAGVVDETITRDTTSGEMEFALLGQTGAVKVWYKGIAAKNFEAGKEVVVEGQMQTDGKFKANQIITRCESKYKTRLKKSL